MIPKSSVVSAKFKLGKGSLKSMRRELTDPAISGSDVSFYGAVESGTGLKILPIAMVYAKLGR